MKKFSKKLLSILVSIAMLIGIALPAGVISASASEDPTVYVTDLTTGTFYPGYIEGSGKNVYYKSGTYDISFEYYMPETPSGPVKLYCSQNSPLISGDCYLYAGYHTFNASFELSSSGAFVPGIRNCNGTVTEITELYLWNYSITISGATVSASGQTGTCAEYSYEHTLNYYDWSTKMAESPSVTEITFPSDTNYQHRWGVGIYKGTTEDAPYEISFDYFLPTDFTTLYVRCATGSHPQTLTGSRELEKTAGYHHFSWTGYKTDLFYPRIQGTVGQTLYIWNYSFKINGQRVDPQSYGQADGAATAEGGKLLCQYDWAKPTLSVSTLPTKTTYAFGEKLDTTGMVVTLSDIFGNSDTIAAEDYTVGGFDSSTEGEKTVTVTYGEYTATFTVTVGDPTVTEVDFSTGNKLRLIGTKSLGGTTAEAPFSITFDYYLAGENRVLFNNESSGYSPVTSAGEPVLYPGRHTFSVKQYLGNSTVTDYTPRLLNPNTDAKLYIWNFSASVGSNTYSLNTGNSTATVTTGDKLSTYDWAKTVTDTLDTQTVYKIEPAADSVGTKIYYDGSVSNAYQNGRVWYYRFDYYMAGDATASLVNGSNSAALSLSSDYESNVTLTEGYGSVEAYLASGSTQYPTGIKLESVSATFSGTPVIYVWNVRMVLICGGFSDANYYYDTLGNPKGTATTTSITMAEAKTAIDAYENPTVTGITVSTLPTKTTYELGESLDATGLAVAKTLSNGNTETIAAADYTVAGYDSAKFGEQTVTVFYGSHTATFTVTVNDPTVIAINYDLQADGETATDTSSNWDYNLAFFYKLTNVDNPYTLSFDYYMPNANNASVNIEGGDVNGTPVDPSVSSTLQQGYHTFSKQYYTTSSGGGLFAPRLRVVGSSLTAGADDIIYIWNLKVTQGGTEVDRKPKASTVYADSSMTLSEYSWSKYIDDAANAGMAFKLNFSDLTKENIEVSLGYNGSLAATANAEWTYSFEYYMPEESAIYLRRAEGGASDGLEDETTGSRYLQQGRHTYSAVFTPTQTTTPGFGYTYTAGSTFEGISDLYIWNITLTNGTTVKQVTPKTTWAGLANTVAGLKELIPVAEVMAAMASDATPIVTKIDFGTQKNWYDSNYRRYNLSGVSQNDSRWTADGKTAQDAVWEISFEYYLPTDSTITFGSVSSGLHPQAGSSDTTLMQGHHRFIYLCTSTADTAGQIVPRLANAAQDATLYMWNYTVKVFDTAVTSTSGRYSSSSSATETNVGLLTAQDWYSTMDDQTVTKLDFDNVKADYVDKTTRYHSLGMYSYEGTKDTTPVYEVSFDYYLPNDCGIYVEIIGGDSNGTPVKGYTPSLEQGRHTFSCEYTMPNYLFAPAFAVKTEDMSDSVNEVIYVWNYRITKNGGLMNPNSGSSAATTAASYQHLNSATFVVPAVDMTAAEETENLGAQLRIGDKSIRFVGAIECDGVEYNPGADADYNDATITIDGKVYDLVGAGMVFTRSKKLLSIPELALRLGKSNVYNVPAKKIQSPENAERLGFGGEGIVFTAVIMNIPRDNWDETLSARPYVKYIDKNGDEQVLYGDIVSRSVMQVKEVTDSEGPSSSMDKEAEDRRNEILGNIEATPTTGTVYYVSNTDEKIPDGATGTLIKTLEEVNALKGESSAPITVLFKRGDTWRGTLTPTSYTTYGAYGSGDKPQILGSMMNYATDVKRFETEDLFNESGDVLGWVCVDETLNKWQLVGSGEYLNTNAVTESTAGNNVGAIFFFDGEGQLVANGKMSTEEAIYAEYAFYQQINYGEPGTVGDLFVCLPTGMTPESYADIEISTNTVVIGLPNYADNNHITIDNLCLKYGAFGIAAHGHYVSNEWAVNDLTVTNCEIGYIGGAMSGTAESHVRYGNGIEIYGPCNEVKVLNNWIHQCYDAGYSNQGEKGTQQNISVTGNLIEYCNYSLEIWMNATTGLIKDADYSGNMLRFAGYQFERDNRIGGSTEAISHLNFFFGAKPCIDVTVTGNIIDTSYRALACVAYPNSTVACKGPKKLEDGTYEVDAEGNYVLYPNEVNAEALSGPMISGNTWIQGYDRYSFVAYMKDKNVKDYEVQELPANNHDEMVASVSAIDTAPEAIKLDK